MVIALDSVLVEAGMVVRGSADGVDRRETGHSFQTLIARVPDAFGSRRGARPTGGSRLSGVRNQGRGKRVRVTGESLFHRGLGADFSLPLSHSLRPMWPRS